MTREKAIDLLSMIEFEQAECCLGTWYKGIDDDMEEALEMAIKALEQEDKIADKITLEEVIETLQTWIATADDEYDREEHGRVCGLKEALHLIKKVGEQEE